MKYYNWLYTLLVVLFNVKKGKFKSGIQYCTFSSNMSHCRSIPLSWNIHSVIKFKVLYFKELEVEFRKVEQTSWGFIILSIRCIQGRGTVTNWEGECGWEQIRKSFFPQQDTGLPTKNEIIYCLFPYVHDSLQVLIVL